MSTTNDLLEQRAREFFEETEEGNAVKMLASFAREIVEQCARKVCGYCFIDGLPEDWIGRSTATPAGDDGGPRFVHVFENGDTVECEAHDIWEAFGRKEGGDAPKVS